MPYGFVIDQRKCIGCHACTVACKAENDVPVGDFRTWVKYVDKGSFPDVKRHFTVMRCNHCDAAPCVEICPVNALEKRADAIVDLNRDVCIGCRACMQACPYDALYLNEHTGTAEKCHYCAHRTEQNLEPACVVVCPEHAIISGDTSNPDGEIATIIREEQTTQRKLEKGTEPRVWYVDANAENLQPGSTTEKDTFLWSDRRTPPAPVPQGFEPPADLVTALNAGHKPAWGWHIWVYLWTKNVAAGAMMIAPFLAGMGVAQEAGSVIGVLPELVALVFLGVTGGLLVHDLGRPERFWRILFAPNTKSWLVKGTWIITAMGLLTTVSLVARGMGHEGLSNAVRFVNFPFALLTSGYTAFLFWQCKGRDLWLAKDLFAHLVLQAGFLGAALAWLLPQDKEGADVVRPLFVILAMANAIWFGWAHRFVKLTRDGERAAKIMEERRAPRRAFVVMLWAGLFGLLAMTSTAPESGLDILLCIGSLGLATFALLKHEREFIKAGQEVPNS